jgi:hypothetical protein
MPFDMLVINNCLKDNIFITVGEQSVTYGIADTGMSV